MKRSYKYNLLKDESEKEITIIVEDGGVACIRQAEPLDENTPRSSTTDYYQTRVTAVDLSLIDENTSIWELLAEGKMYYNDWEIEYDDPQLIEDALSWLGFDIEECELTEKPLFPTINF